MVLIAANVCTLTYLSKQTLTLSCLINDSELWTGQQLPQILKHHSLFTVRPWSPEDIELSIMVHRCPLPSYKRTQINLSYCEITESPSPPSMSIPRHLTHLTHASRPSHVPSFTLPSPYFSLAVPPCPSSSTHLSFRAHAASHLTSLCTSGPALSPRFSTYPLLSLSLSLAVHWFSLPLFTCPIWFSLHIFIPSSTRLSIRFNSNIGERIEGSMLRLLRWIVHGRFWWEGIKCTAGSFHCAVTGKNEADQTRRAGISSM